MFNPSGPNCAFRVPTSTPVLFACQHCSRQLQTLLHLSRRYLRQTVPMAYRHKLKNKKPPEGWELIEEVIEDFETQVCPATAAVCSLRHLAAGELLCQCAA